MKRIRLLSSAAALIGTFDIDVGPDEQPAIVEFGGNLFALQIAGTGLPNDQPAVRSYLQAEPLLVEASEEEAQAEGAAPAADPAADAALAAKVRERAQTWLDEKIERAPAMSAEELANSDRAVGDMIEETGLADLAGGWSTAHAARTAALKAEAEKGDALGELLAAEIEKAKTATGDQLVELDAGVRKLLGDESRNDLLPSWEAAFDARKTELAA